VAEIRARLAPGTPIEVWFQDEMRVGQKNKLTYRWAIKGSRPRAVHDQRTQSTYVFGAVCPELGTGAALVLPVCNTEAMQRHLNEIATKVTPGAHAILILDQAGWHGAKGLKAPANISLLPLPPRSPELNPQENIWQTVCSSPCGGGSSTLCDERGLRRIGRRRASRTEDEPCNKISGSLSVLIPPRTRSPWHWRKMAAVAKFVFSETSTITQMR
jgi:hypothetical protein